MAHESADGDEGDGVDGLIRWRKRKTGHRAGAWLPLILAMMVVWTFETARVWSHVGAPYLVAVQQKAGPYTVTIWADPDVGNGRFFIQAVQGKQEAGADTAVTVWVRPAGSTEPERPFRAQAPEEGGMSTFLATVPFASKGIWDVRVGLSGPSGQGELSMPVNVTPAFPQALTTALWLLPFVLAGFLWWVAVMHRRRAQKEVEVAAGDRQSNPGCRLAGSSGLPARRATRRI